MNEIIPLILTAVISFCAGWFRGNYMGHKDERNEADFRATKIARRRAMLSPAEDY